MRMQIEYELGFSPTLFILLHVMTGQLRSPKRVEYNLHIICSSYFTMFHHWMMEGSEEERVFRPWVDKGIGRGELRTLSLIFHFLHHLSSLMSSI